jgi:hypothetical protein
MDLIFISIGLRGEGEEQSGLWAVGERGYSFIRANIFSYIIFIPLSCNIFV